MIQDNASFTFLHRIEEVELNIEDGRWQLRCEYLHQNKALQILRTILRFVFTWA